VIPVVMMVGRSGHLDWAVKEDVWAGHDERVGGMGFDCPTGLSDECLGARWNTLLHAVDRCTVLWANHLVLSDVESQLRGRS
jgi:hypothetical protein